jgi:hypothetical protein
MMEKPFTVYWCIYEKCPPSLVEAQGNRAVCETAVPLEEASERGLSFGRLLLQAVDEGLCTIGESMRNAVYRYLEDTFGIRKTDIPRRVDEFSDGLERIFGNGARLLEIEIMKNLCRKVGDIADYFPTKEDITFAEYVYAAELSSHSACAPRFKESQL